MPYIQEMNLIEAAKIGSYAQTERCLTKNPPDPIYMTDASGLNALHWVAKQGHTHLLYLLVSHHANLEATVYENKMTALLIAAAEHQSDIVEQLIMLGARTDYTAEDGSNALHYALVGQIFNHHLKTLSAPDFKNFKTIEILLRLHTLYTPDLQKLIDLTLEDAIEVDYVDFLNTLIDLKLPINTHVATKELPIANILYHALIHNSIQCLTRFNTWDPELFKVPALPYRLLGLNLFHFFTHAIPEIACFELAHIISESQIKTQDELSECLESYFAQHPEMHSQIQINCHSNPESHGSLCVQSIITTDPNRTIYFDTQGNVINTAYELDKLNQTIQFLKNQGCDINQVSSAQYSPSRELLCTPREILEIFIKNGLKFSGADLAHAIKTARADVVACLIENHTDVCWKDENNQNAVELLESGNYPQLINDPLFAQLLLLARAEWARQQYPENRPIHPSQFQIIPENALILDSEAATLLFQWMTGTLSEVDNAQLAELESEEPSEQASEPELESDPEASPNILHR